MPELQKIPIRVPEAGPFLAEDTAPDGEESHALVNSDVTVKVTVAECDSP